jgi:hypothetical protein
MAEHVPKSYRHGDLEKIRELLSDPTLTESELCGVTLASRLPSKSLPVAARVAASARSVSGRGGRGPASLRGSR